MALARHDASAIWAAIPFTKPLTHASGETKQRTAGFHIPADVPINGLVAEFKVVVYPEAAAELFGIPALPNHQPDMVPMNGGELRTASGSFTSSGGIALRGFSSVAAVIGFAVSRQLAANSAGRAAHQISDARLGEFSSAIARNQLLFALGKLAMII